MRIHAPCVVALTWTLRDGTNQPIDELTEPMEFFFGGDDLLEKVEEALDGHAAGDRLELHLEPEHAFGDYHPELVCFESRSLFPEQLETGMAFEGLPPGADSVGMPEDLVYFVTEIYPGHVVLDGNHPLAGMALRLSVEVNGVRDATPDEVEARSVAPGLLSLAGRGTPPALH